MKQTVLLSIAIILSLSSLAQNRTEFFKAIPTQDKNTPEWAKLMYSENPNVPNVEHSFQYYYKYNEFIKNIHTQNHKYWIKQVEPLLNKQGYIVIPTEAEERAKSTSLKTKLKNETPNKDNRTSWSAMGPFETFSTNNAQAISWHKNIYCLDQSLSNPNLLICGTEAGGVYKSIDKAQNWSLITAGEEFGGNNSAVKIHPTNEDNFLVASNRRIYQSLDGGATWAERAFTDGTANEFEYSPANNDIIFHTSSSGLFKTVDGGTTWAQIYSEYCWDIDFHPSNNSVVYLLKSNEAAKKSEFFKSDDGGNSWVIKENGWYNPSDFNNAVEHGGKIAVTPASTDVVYVCLIGDSKAGDDGWIGIYKSTDQGESWTNPSGQDGSPYGATNTSANWNVAAYDDGYHQGYYNFDMEVSPFNADKIWVASIRLSESTDGGQTFQSIGAANSTRLDLIHADVQDIEVNGSDIWVATDGGIDFSADELMTHVALNKGIQAADFWGFNTGWNEDSFTGGKYHDGTTGWYENYGVGKAYNIGGVEEASGYVHPIESRRLLYRTHYASDNTSVKTIPETFGDAIVNNPTLPIRPNESYNVAERSGVYFDPRYADHIYVGLENKLYKSTNGGINFDVIYTFPETSGLIYEIEISRSNPDVMYCVYNKLGGYWDLSEIWKSTDGGMNWNKTVSSPTGSNRRFRISIHPEDENTVWLCTPRGEEGQKVFTTSNGGTTWVNKTTAMLAGQYLTDILYQGGTDDIVYITSQYGVFYWDTNTSDWVNYSSNLPLLAKSLQINPFYRDGELRLGTTGRGVFGREMQDPLFTPIAQPITYSDIVNCPSEIIKFDCYSILKHAGASWEWTISPTPQSISSTSVRNPEVVFGSAGEYTVSLTVTDAQGNSDTKTIPNMVTVLDDCQHCTSYGDMSYATAVTLVNFNEINNVSGKTQSYTDYADNISTTVEAGNSYALTVNLNTDGDYSIYSTVWIDWNHDIDFDDPGEEYDLGVTNNSPDGITSLSPLNITVPTGAVAGETVMRVSTKFGGSPTNCETGFDGEVEDYAVIISNTSGVLENSFSTKPILYPNPTKGKFSVELRTAQQEINITIKDLTGKIILSETYSNSNSLNLDAPTGIYILTVEAEGKKAMFRLVKE